MDIGHLACKSTRFREHEATGRGAVLRLTSPCPCPGPCPRSRPYEITRSPVTVIVSCFFSKLTLLPNLFRLVCCCPVRVYPSVCLPCACLTILLTPRAPTVTVCMFSDFFCSETITLPPWITSATLGYPPLLKQSFMDLLP